MVNLTGGCVSTEHGPGFFFNDKEREVQPCYEGCNDCDDAESCNECSDGFGKDSRVGDPDICTEGGIGEWLDGQTWNQCGKNCHFCESGILCEECNDETFI